MDNQRNIILAVVLTALILFGWDAGDAILLSAGKQAGSVAATSATLLPTPMRPPRRPAKAG